MHDHNLDDLIIDNIDPKNSKTKSFLTIIALGIIVLIVAIILTKVILKDPKSKIALEENHTEMISPELTLQNKPKKATQKETLTLNTEKKSNIETNSSNEKQEEIKKSLKEKIKSETVEITDTFSQNEESPEEENKETQQVEKKSEKEKIAKHKSSIEKDSKNVFYIQVGSFAKTPSTRFLSIIKKSGFNHKITSASNKGIKKLLIGPYKTKVDATGALPKVKDRINKSAFIIKK